MAEGVQETFTVMFSDVAGSTALYDKLGDVAAEEQISSLVEYMIATNQKHNGILIKTIGDEVMSRFVSPADALRAAVEIQLTLQQRRQRGENVLGVRIGMHHGLSIVKDGDLFGDTVNVAARMAGLALEHQIITTVESIALGASEAGLNSRCINALYIKGKGDPIDVYEVLWQPDDVELTALFSSQQAVEQHMQVSVKYAGQSYCLNSHKPTLMIGRGPQCDIEVASSAASRVHAKLEWRRDKVILTDQSTNGTFLVWASGEALFLQKESIPLTNRGVLSLGAPSHEAAAGEHNIQFCCEYCDR